MSIQNLIELIDWLESDFLEFPFHVRLNHKINLWVDEIRKNIDQLMWKNISQFLELFTVDSDPGRAWN